MQRSTLPFLLLLPLLLGVCRGYGQITLTSAYFPEIGDSLLTNQASNEYRDGITFQPPGENLTWDFGEPDVRYQFTEVLEAVVGDTLFVDADARLTSAAFTYEYYQTTDTAYNLVGLVGTLPFLRDTLIRMRITPPRPVKRAGVTYGDQFTTTSVRELRLHVDSLPPEVRSGTAGILLGAYDSLRIVNTSVRTDEIDAYGTLRLRGRAYEVLREKRVEQLETRVYLKAGNGSYDDFTDLIRTFDPASGQYVGRQPAEGTYYFWAQGVKEPIVEIEFDENERPTTFLYVRGERSPTSVAPTESLRAVSLRPNPVTDDFALLYELSAPASVRATLYTADGRAVRRWPEREEPAGLARLSGNLGGLPTGVYYLQVENADGRITQKIVRQ